MAVSGSTADVAAREVARVGVGVAVGHRDDARRARSGRATTVAVTVPVTPCVSATMPGREPVFMRTTGPVAFAPYATELLHAISRRGAST